VSLAMGVADLGWGHADHGHDGPGPLNLAVLLAFITWFGGIAYLLRTGLDVAAFFAIVVGIAGGVFGGILIYRLMKLMRSHETIKRAEDYRMPGVIARVTSSIREGGTGEVVYEQAGVRHVAAARASSGRAIPRGTEVVVMNMDRGIVYVELWDELMQSREERKIAAPLEPLRDDANI
jgi:membrane protein implicated in regulation of membrane protease activity